MNNYQPGPVAITRSDADSHAELLVDASDPLDENPSPR